MIHFFIETIPRKEENEHSAYPTKQIEINRAKIDKEERNRNRIFPLKMIVVNDSQKFHGGCLKQFQCVMSNLGAPEQICRLLNGSYIPFKLKPPLILPNPIVIQSYRTKTSLNMIRQIQSMLKSGVLEQAEPSASFLSTFFLVPKPDGSYRPILNLKQLNRFVKTKPFRLFSHFRVPTFLQHQDWMAKLDLSQAYFHVPIARRHRRYLRLNYPINSNQHQLLQMTCLPFGLSSAPRTFASITNWVAEFLRNRGIRCVVYLDDFLLASQSMQQLQEDISLTIKIMQLLGWTINFEKSVLTPTQCLEFLGITWDTKLNAMSLSEKKCLTLRNALQQQLLKRKWSLKQYQILMRRLNFATYVTRRGRLHCRTLQYFSRQLSKDHPYRQVSIPLPVQSEMEWWLQAVGQSVPIHTNVVLTHLLTTDASDIGWGAQLGDISIGGTWTKRQLTWHANRKEMFAVQAAISHEQKLLQNSQVLLQTDNRTVVSYINKEGGSKSKKLLEQTLQLLALLDKFNIHLQAQYFPDSMSKWTPYHAKGLAPSDT
ncbi:unnamed protein product [Parnassius mnemosyne]|uniref:Reverse transcriptase domain-containing protein n=1 Tax=Parnassius mnemosyne TaxID=213953 RepID=A0AAV1L2T4_9NEOP